MRRARAVTDGATVLAAVDVEASAERAFEALNSAEVERWWGAPGLYIMRGWRSDLRVGGQWRVDVCFDDGAVLQAGGEYLAVEAPHRVNLTRRYDWDHPTLGRSVTKVTYRFDPTGSGTRVTVRQDDFGSVETAREHAAGWERTLDFLCDHLTPGGQAARLEAAGTATGTFRRDAQTSVPARRRESGLCDNRRPGRRDRDHPKLPGRTPRSRRASVPARPV
jgi:uncharacterized protein YndB with AHSA1/START domain